MADDEQKIGEEGAPTGAFEASKSAGDYFTVPADESPFADKTEASALGAPDEKDEKPATQPAPAEPETPPTADSQPDAASQQPLQVTPQQEEQVQQAVETYFNAAEQVLDELQASVAQQAQAQEAQEDGERIEMSQEVIAQLAEIRALIAHMRSADADGSVSDEIADLETAHASLMAILSSVQAGSSMAGLAGLKTLIQGAKQTAENAISDAGVSYDVAKADLRSEKYATALSYWRETQSSYALERHYMQQFEGIYSQDAVRASVDLATKYTPELFDRSEDFANKVIGTHSAVMDDPKHQDIRNRVANITPEQDAAIDSAQEQAMKDYRWAMKNLPEGHPLRDTLQQIYSKTKGQFTVAMADSLAQLRQDGVKPDSVQEFSEHLDSSEQLFDKSYEMLWAKLPPEKQAEMIAELKERGVELDPNNPDWSKVAAQLDALPSDDESVLSELRFGQKLTFSALVVNESILQLEAKDRARFAELSPEQKIKLLGVDDKLLADMSPEDKDRMLEMADALSRYAAENPEAFAAAQKDANSLERLLTENVGMKHYDGQLTLEQYNAYGAAIALKNEANRQAYEQAAQMYGSIEDESLRERSIRAKAKLLATEIETKLLENSEQREVIESVLLTDNIRYDIATQAYVDIQAQQSLSPQEAQRRLQEEAAGKSSSMSPEGEVVIQTSQPETVLDKLNAIRADSLSSAPAQAAVTVQGGMVALESEGQSSALPEPANQNMLNALKQAQGQGAIPSTDVAYNPAEDSPAATPQMSAMPDKLPSLEAEDVKATDVRKQSTLPSPAAGVVRGPR